MPNSRAILRSAQPCSCNEIIDCCSSTLVMFDIPKVVHFHPQTTGTFYPQIDKNQQVFIPSILNFPIGVSFAIYDDTFSSLSTRPLVWTRGLHRYAEFDQNYAGYVAYLDGHVRYFDGRPDSHDQDLVYTFSEASGFSNAIRILEHVPDEWADKKLEPLPIRYTRFTNITRRGRGINIGYRILMVAPIMLGIAAGIATVGSVYRRLLLGFLTFLLFVVLILGAVPIM